VKDERSQNAEEEKSDSQDFAPRSPIAGSEVSEQQQNK
jgi:hypothetical protein